MLHLKETNATPPGGWKYTEARTGLHFPFPGSGTIYAWDVLLSMVRKHREATDGDLEIGWLERFIDDLCRQNPEYPCMEEAPYSERKIGLPELKRFAYTVQKHLENGGTLVAQEEAERRAAICVRCPRNIQLGGCLGCSSVSDVFQHLFVGKETSKDNELHSCAVCGCHLPSKVWIEKSVMSNEGISMENFPDYCWMVETNQLQEL